MELYVKISFWLNVVVFTTGIITLVTADFPKERKQTLGREVASALLALGFALWAGIVLWMK